MRSLLVMTACTSLMFTACRPAVSMAEPSGAELASVLGTVRTLEVRVPRSARSFMLSGPGAVGGPLGDVRLHAGALRITVGLIDGCPGGSKNLRIVGPFGSGGTCVPLPGGYGTQELQLDRTAPLPLNRWVPLYAVQPLQREQTRSVPVKDPARWHVVSVYFSDQPDIAYDDLPDPGSALQSLK